MLFSWTLRARISGSCWARSSVVSRAPAVGGVCVGWGVGVCVGVRGGEPALLPLSQLHPLVSFPGVIFQ